MTKETRAVVKDYITILVFIGTIVGGYFTIKTTIEQHTKELNELNTKMDKQLELNGKIIQYIEMDSKE